MVYRKKEREGEREMMMMMMMMMLYYMNRLPYVLVACLYNY